MPLSVSACLSHRRSFRFESDIVYSYTGDVVISVNPFKYTGCVGGAIMHKYTGAQRRDAPPHIYPLVHAAYEGLLRGPSAVNQSVIISGESGAGKTEAMKICLACMVGLGGHSAGGGGGAGGGASIAHKLTQTNPVMEAFGNAKTTRNNNSSRFGKHFDVQFSPNGGLLGAHTTAYLLERPRILEHAPGERNYHVFYFLLAAPEGVRAPIGMGDSRWESFRVLAQAGTVPTAGTVDDAAEFMSMHEALLDVGFSPPERDGMYTLLALLLRLGNLPFRAKDSDGEQAEVADVPALEQCAAALQVPSSKLAAALTSRHVDVGEDHIVKPLDAKRAAAARCAHPPRTRHTTHHAPPPTLLSGRTLSPFGILSLAVLVALNGVLSLAVLVALNGVLSLAVLVALNGGLCRAAGHRCASGCTPSPLPGASPKSTPTCLRAASRTSCVASACSTSSALRTLRAATTSRSCASTTPTSCCTTSSSSTSSSRSRRHAATRTHAARHAWEHTSTHASHVRLALACEPSPRSVCSAGVPARGRRVQTGRLPGQRADPRADRQVADVPDGAA
jgi:hypothetical protein